MITCKHHDSRDSVANMVVSGWLSSFVLYTCCEVENIPKCPIENEV